MDTPHMHLIHAIAAGRTRLAALIGALKERSSDVQKATSGGKIWKMMDLWKKWLERATKGKHNIIEK